VFSDSQDLGENDLDVVRADTGGKARDGPTLERTRRRCELPMPMLPLDAVEALGDFGGSILVPGQQDVLGELPRPEAYVVLALGVRDRDSAVGDRQSVLLRAAIRAWLSVTIGTF
jgi:hypothetical protein